MFITVGIFISLGILLLVFLASKKSVRNHQDKDTDRNPEKRQKDAVIWKQAKNVLIKIAGVTPKIVTGFVLIGTLFVFMLAQPDIASDPLLESYSELSPFKQVIVWAVLLMAFWGVLRICLSEGDATKWIAYALGALALLYLFFDVNPLPSESRNAVSRYDYDRGVGKNDVTKEKSVIGAYLVTLEPRSVAGPYEHTDGTCEWIGYPEGERRPGKDLFDVEFTGKNYDKWITAERWWKLNRQGLAPFQHSSDWQIRSKTDNPLTLLVKVKRYGTC